MLSLVSGWRVGKDRVQRIWRREGLKVPRKHRPRSRLWLNHGSCVRLRPLHRNRVWSFDFVQGHTHDGRSLRILTLLDEHSRACLALKVARRINSLGVIEALADAMCLHGIPDNIRCDSGPEMISKAVRKWVAKTGPLTQGSSDRNWDLTEYVQLRSTEFALGLPAARACRLPDLAFQLPMAATMQ